MFCENHKYSLTHFLVSIDQNILQVISKFWIVKSQIFFKFDPVKKILKGKKMIDRNVKI